MLCEKERCVGCGACAAVCSTSSISMDMDDNGFYSPTIDNTLCVQCGRCSQVCPVLHELPALERIAPKAYAAKTTDPHILEQSASGGGFTLLAHEIFRRNGEVWGAVWKNGCEAVYACARNEEELAPIRGSKYVQSSMGDAYGKIKESLQAGRTVLFSGVPCQVSALYAYLGNEAYPNLYTAEIVCHGGGSPQMFQEYLHLVERDKKSKLTSLCQTDKTNPKYPWNLMIPRITRMDFSDGSIIWKDTHQEPYLFLFLEGLLYRKGCYQCKFAGFPRHADITLGDIFGYGVLGKHGTDPTGGISLVLINTRKGESLFEHVRKQAAEIILEPYALEECMVYNHNLWRPSREPADRDALFALWRKEGFESVIEHYYNSKKYKTNRLIRKTIKKMIGKRATALGMGILYWRRYKEQIEEKITAACNDAVI